MFNKKLNLAIEALAYISLNSSQKAVSSKDICEALEVKLRYTESLMQQLVKAGVVKGVRGAGGGYFLANDRRKISVAEIYEIVENLKNERTDDSRSPFSALSDEVNQTLEGCVRKALGDITMDEIYNKALKIRSGTGKNRKSDFVI